MLIPEGREAPEGRPITFANPQDGKLYDFSIGSFVTVQTVRMLTKDGVLATPQLVAQLMDDVAAALSADGWFTREEWQAAIAAEAVKNVDEELKNLEGWT